MNEKTDNNEDSITIAQNIETEIEKLLNSNVKFESTENNSENFLVFDDEILEDEILTDIEKRKKMLNFFLRTASNGDYEKLMELLENEEKKKWIDINGKDENGTTALIYASCFSQVKCAYLLVKHGADVNISDKFGWTAIVWAVNNHHDELVRVLLAGGANIDKKLSTGRTLKDYTTHIPDNENLLKIINNPPTQFNSKFDINSDEPLFKFDPLFNLKLSSVPIDDLKFLNNTEKDDQYMDFSWNKCLNYQMFVFEECHLDLIFDYVILGMKQTKGIENTYIPANVIFLAARYAHYYNSNEMMKSLFNTVFKKIGILLKKIHQKADINTHIYWLTNLLQLVYYLKKDSELVISTVEYQYEISELIHELYINLINHIEERLEDIVEPSLMQYNTIPDIEELKFESSFSRLGRRKGFRAQLSKGNSRIPKKSKLSFSQLQDYSPQRILTILSSLLCALRTYKVHTSVIQQIIQQLLYFINAEIFNRLLTDSDYCCRSRSMQVRLNITAVIDWIRDTINYISDIDPKDSTLTEEQSIHQHQISNQLLRQLSPSIKLCQLLQVCTSFTDLDSFLDIMESILKDDMTSAIASSDGVTTISVSDLNNGPSLSMAQMRVVFDLYRYEVDEPKINSEIIKYINQQIKRIKEDEKFRDIMSENGSEFGDKEINGKNYSMYSDNTNNSNETGGNVNKKIDLLFDDDNKTIASTLSTSSEFEDPLLELLDTKFILPFGIPTWKESDKSYICHNTPTLPKEFIDKIDSMCKERDQLKIKTNLMDDTLPRRYSFTPTPLSVRSNSNTNSPINNNNILKSTNNGISPKTPLSNDLTNRVDYKNRSSSNNNSSISNNNNNNNSNSSNSNNNNKYLPTSPKSSSSSSSQSSSGRSSPYGKSLQRNKPITPLPPLPPLSSKNSNTYTNVLNRPTLPPLPPLSRTKSPPSPLKKS